MRTRSLLAVIALTGLVGSGCDALTEAIDETPNADGTYKGDAQVVVQYSDTTPTGGAVLRTKSVTWAVGFTIEGDKVITTNQAGTGQAIWDGANNMMTVEFQSIFSDNESFCSRWRYYGVLPESEHFLTGEGSLSCQAPNEQFNVTTYSFWKVTRQ
jgi:hypothetical protein